MSDRFDDRGENEEYFAYFQVRLAAVLSQQRYIAAQLVEEKCLYVEVVLFTPGSRDYAGNSAV